MNLKSNVCSLKFIIIFFITKRAKKPGRRKNYTKIKRGTETPKASAITKWLNWVGQDS